MPFTSAMLCTGGSNNIERSIKLVDFFRLAFTRPMSTSITCILFICVTESMF